MSVLSYPGIDSIRAEIRVSIREISRRYFPDKDKVILDLGCGWCEHLKTLLGLGYSRLIGIDNELSAGNDVRNLAGIKLVVADLVRSHIPLAAQTVDIVLCFHLIEHLKEPFGMLQESLRVLREDGYLLLVTPDWRRSFRDFYSDPTHVRPYVRESLIQSVQAAGFEVLRCSQFNVRRPFGITQLWRWFPRLLFTGDALFAACQRKPGTKVSPMWELRKGRYRFSVTRHWF